MITLPKLPFEKTALEPIVSAQTIEFHYGKHHQAYVDNLNKLIQGTEIENLSLEEIVKTSQGGIFNNAAQVWNHTFYWESLGTPDQSELKGTLLDAIIKDFGSFDQFKEKFSTACATLFGSGWVWLSKDSNNTLVITQESNAGNPMLKGLKPILTCDVWEHAYYIDRQNRRPEYVKEFWRIINWEKVSARF